MTRADFYDFRQRHKSLVVFILALLLIQFGVLTGVYLHGRKFRTVDEACSGTFGIKRDKLGLDVVAIYEPFCSK